jgi:hypothetical protein
MAERIVASVAMPSSTRITTLFCRVPGSRTAARHTTAGQFGPLGRGLSFDRGSIDAIGGDRIGAEDQGLPLWPCDGAQGRFRVHRHSNLADKYAIEGSLQAARHLGGYWQATAGQAKDNRFGARKMRKPLGRERPAVRWSGKRSILQLA